MLYLRRRSRSRPRFAIHLRASRETYRYADDPVAVLPFHHTFHYFPRVLCELVLVDIAEDPSPLCLLESLHGTLMRAPLLPLKQTTLYLRGSGTDVEGTCEVTLSATAHEVPATPSGCTSRTDRPSRPSQPTYFLSYSLTRSTRHGLCGGIPRLT